MLSPYHESPGVTLYHGDCRTVLAELPDCSIDAVVTDPPAGIAFMGLAFDSDRGGRTQWIAWLTEIMVECCRVLKPGAHGLVWSLPRTSHWTATALENAGFRIIDRIAHLQGQGFPKNRHQLKPAVEDWWLIRAPLAAKSVEANIAAWGTGGLNIDAARIRPSSPSDYNHPGNSGIEDHTRVYGQWAHKNQMPPNEGGRWPSNLVLSHAPACTPRGTKRVKGNQAPTPSKTRPSGYAMSDQYEPIGYADPDGTETVAAWNCEPGCAVAELDRQSGVRKSGARIGARSSTSGTGYGSIQLGSACEASEGSASRFFPCFPADPPDVPFKYQPKAPRSERVGSMHPTQKSLTLMDWLCRLVTPPGGTILDPFAGSGTTGVAALRCGFFFVGVEQDADYIAIAQRRIAAVQPPLVGVSA